MHKTIAALLALVAATPVLGDTPVVVTDIAPVHSLVAQVMDGAGAPTLIVPPGATPHGYAMRPSEAALLARADVVFWVGAALTPALGTRIDTLAPKARAVALLDAPGTVRLDARTGATFASHAHEEEEEEEAGDDHDNHGTHDTHDDHAAEAGHDDHDDHDAHGPLDPHAWLDPENGRLWLGVIAATLAETDPANAALYTRNAAAGAAELDALRAELDATLAPVRGRSFVVFHDAFHYFEARFGIEAAGALSSGEGAAPGPARVAEIRDTVRDLGVACVFAEPQFAAGLIATITEGTPARAAVLDPLGTTAGTGPDLYPAVLRGIGTAMAGCLAQGS